MAVNTLITIKDALTNFVDQHEQLQRIEFEADDHRAPKIESGDLFPVLFVAPIQVEMVNSMNIHTLRIYVYEKINDNRDDVYENANDTSLILRDIKVWWNNFGDGDIQIIGDQSGDFLSDRELDNLVGYMCDFRFEIPAHGRCDVPITPIPPFSPTCLPASYTVEYENGTLIEQGTIPSGGSVTVEVPDTPTCDDATWELRDTDNNLLDSGSIPSGGSATIVAPDANISLNGVSFPSIPSGGSDNIEVRQENTSTQVGSKQGQYWRIADSTITVNSDAYTDLPATDSLNIPIVDSNGDPVATTIIGSDVQVDNLPCSGGVTRSTATLMKTGQTVSSVTGDDGDIQAGRPTDFDTLDTAPVHDDGSATLNTTTNRWTDTLGGQVYADNIVLDWSTWNGATLLAYSLDVSATTEEWAPAVSACLAYTNGTFTTGWRMPNFNEGVNMCNHGRNSFVEGGVFDSLALFNIWTSTDGQTSSSARLLSLPGKNFLTRPKTQSFYWLAVRTMNLSTSNILS